MKNTPQTKNNKIFLHDINVFFFFFFPFKPFYWGQKNVFSVKFRRFFMLLLLDQQTVQLYQTFSKSLQNQHQI